jgi:hypothetical protein
MSLLPMVEQVLEGVSLKALNFVRRMDFYWLGTICSEGYVRVITWQVTFVTVNLVMRPD